MNWGGAYYNIFVLERASGTINCTIIITGHLSHGSTFVLNSRYGWGSFSTNRLKWGCSKSKTTLIVVLFIIGCRKPTFLELQQGRIALHPTTPQPQLQRLGAFATFPRLKPLSSERITLICQPPDFVFFNRLEIHARAWFNFCRFTVSTCETKCLSGRCHTSFDDALSTTPYFRTFA